MFYTHPNTGRMFKIVKEYHYYTILSSAVINNKRNWFPTEMYFTDTSNAEHFIDVNYRE